MKYDEVYFLNQQLTDIMIDVVDNIKDLSLVNDVGKCFEEVSERFYEFLMTKVEDIK